MGGGGLGYIVNSQIEGKSQFFLCFHILKTFADSVSDAA